MGLFDNIKKSLFGKQKDEPQAQVEEPAEQIVEQDHAEVDAHKDEQVVSQIPVADEPAEPAKTEQEAEQPENVQDLYDRGLEKSNQGLGAKLNAFFAKFRSVDEEFFEQLEELLIESDVGFETSEDLVEKLRDEAKLHNAKSKEDLKQVVIHKIIDLYDESGDPAAEKLTFDEQNLPNVYLFVGVNGAGKTTTVGKLAQRLKDEGKKVVLVAADTFRAGAVAQLAQWADRTGVEIVTGKEQADPAAVVFDGIEHAINVKADYVLVDTAGRLQNKVNLMNELDKIQRTIKKVLPTAPQETLLVIDGSTGQNALLQAKDFDKTTKLTGLVLTKLDGSAKGGIILSIRNELHLPVKLVGLGEKASDLADFDAQKYAIGLFHGLI